MACSHRDPLTCLARQPVGLSDHALDGWRDTALHILRLGCVPVVPIEARRALWLRGGADRVLAELLTGGAAA